MKNQTTLSLLTATIIGLTGCGGGATSDSSAFTKTLTGYYVDEVIIGANYSCSSTDSTSVTGTTGQDGDFNYTIGQSCTFSVGGIVVETTEALNSENAVITEDDPDDLGYLLTLDNDGNPNNGITITPSIENSASNYNSQNINGTAGEVDLDEISSVIDAEVTDYNGTSASPTTIATQVINAQAAQCVRNLIGGETWYIVEGQGAEITKYVVNTPVTHTRVNTIYPTTNAVSTEDVAVVGDQLWIELDVDVANGLEAGRDYVTFQACKTNATLYPNYLESTFFSGNTNQLATPSGLYRWYNNYNDALTYSLTGQ